MPRFYLQVEGDDAEGHAVKVRGLEQGPADVTVREDATGMEVKGHLRREGEELVFETAEDDAEAHAAKFKFLDQEGDVTIRFEGGDEVKGHAARIKF